MKNYWKWIILIVTVAVMTAVTIAAWNAEEAAAKWIVMFLDLAIIVFSLWQWKLSEWFKPKTK